MPEYFFSKIMSSKIKNKSSCHASDVTFYSYVCHKWDTL